MSGFAERTGGTARRRTVPTELAALAMGVSQATIRKWASRGKITRHGSPQRAEYDLEELLALTRRDARAPKGPSA
ncbi:hypothetical protein [Streptomyces coelicoflavus]|uniref:hypothetical protein n=1 Tax=Streptomyces coelicoflavus TaxID=285562 RepID=UPI003A8920D9